MIHLRINSTIFPFFLDLRHKLEKEKARKLSKEEKLVFRGKVSNAIHDYLNPKETIENTTTTSVTTSATTSRVISNTLNSNVSRSSPQTVKSQMKKLASVLGARPVPSHIINSSTLSDKRQKEEMQHKKEKFQNATKAMEAILHATPTNKWLATRKDSLSKSSPVQSNMKEYIATDVLSPHRSGSKSPVIISPAYSASPISNSRCGSRKRPLNSAVSTPAKKSRQFEQKILGARWPVKDSVRSFDPALPLNCEAITDKLHRRRIVPPKGLIFKNDFSRPPSHIPTARIKSTASMNTPSTADVVGPVSVMMKCPVCGGKSLVNDVILSITITLSHNILKINHCFFSQVCMPPQ